MKKMLSSLSIKNYLQIANITAIFLASGLGVAVSSQEELKSLMRDKYTYTAFLVGCFFAYYMAVEYFASRKMYSLGHRLHMSVLGNPLLKVSLLRLVLLIAGGWLVLARYELGGSLSYLTLSVLVAFFIGGFFEFYRSLKRSI